MHTCNSMSIINFHGQWQIFDKCMYTQVYRLYHEGMPILGEFSRLL